jgi:DNA primase
MSWPPEFLDEIRRRVALSALIGRRIKLMRKGREHLGLCPFHNERTPSFTVNDDKAFYHCFGCGAHGDAIGFVMNSEGLGFREAVEKLAAEAGVPMPPERPVDAGRQERERSLFDAVEATTAFFEKQLRLPAGRAAMDYLKRRGLDEATIGRFRLGYAPGQSGALKVEMKRRGFEADVLISAGLLKQPDDGRDPFEYFRDRVMFPIADRRGRIVAFGGRILDDGQPKYLNSPDTPLFRKGRLLYGYAQARESAHKSGEIAVVEGYMDVIALAQAGIEHAVAPLGTALTEDQIRELWRLAPEPIVCFDGDEAGRRAAARALERALPLLEPGKSLRFVELPQGEDPDSLVRQHGAKAFRELLASPEALIQRLWDVEWRARPVDTPERRADLNRRLKARLDQIADRTIRDYYRQGIEDAARRVFAPGAGQGLDRDRHEPWTGRGRRWRPPPPAPPGGRAARARVGDVLSRRQEQILLATLMQHPPLLDEMGECIGNIAFSDAKLSRLHHAMLNLAAGFEASATLDSAELCRHLKGLGFSELVDTLRGDGVLQHASFARPGASLESARQGLGFLVARAGRAQLEVELEEAEQTWVADPTEANWARLDRLRHALQALNVGAESDAAP